AQGPEHLRTGGAARSAEQAAEALAQAAVTARRAEPVLLANPVGGDDRAHHTRSAKLCSMRRKYKNPASATASDPANASPRRAHGSGIPNSAARNPSTTADIGFSSSRNRYFSGTSEDG